MYFQLTASVQRRFILELRRFWSYHPIYRDHLVPNIQGKYSFEERPQLGIIVRNASGTQVRLSADNFQGTLHSHALLARVENHPGVALEWVRENSTAIKRNGGVFPSSPGVYYIRIDSVAEDYSSFNFYIDPLLDVIDESLTMLNSTTGRVNSGKFLDGTLAVYLMPGSVRMIEGVNYTTDPEAGTVHFFQPLGDGDFYSVDYRWGAVTPEDSPAILPDEKPWTGIPNRGLIEPLPGVVLAFGRRIEAGDVMAVVISRDRDIAALEFGGKWDLALDFEVIARDPHTQREIADLTVSYIHGVLRSRLSTEGLEIESVSLGGETEEIADETGDDYFYNSSFSLTVQTDWALYVPLAAMIHRVTPQSLDQEKLLAGLSEEEAAAYQNLIRAESSLLGLQHSPKMVEEMGLGLRSFRDPYFRFGAKNFERIR